MSLLALSLGDNNGVALCKAVTLRGTVMLTLNLTWRGGERSLNEIMMHC